jgi:hypothetical protein
MIGSDMHDGPDFSMHTLLCRADAVAELCLGREAAAEASDLEHLACVLVLQDMQRMCPLLASEAEATGSVDTALDCVKGMPLLQSICQQLAGWYAVLHSEPT